MIPSSNPSPNLLLQSIGSGNLVAFDSFYKLFSELVYNTALGYVQNTQDAEEVTQDVFVKVFRKASLFKGNSTVKTWVYRITINTSLNFIQKRNRNKGISFEDSIRELPDFVHPGVLLENKEKSKIIFKAIGQLSENQQTAFILSFIEHLPQKEVATIMELSLKAVESLLQRAKKNLREKLTSPEGYS